LREDDKTFETVDDQVGKVNQKLASKINKMMSGGKAGKSPRGARRRPEPEH
jgi:hypothetical protein